MRIELINNGQISKVAPVICQTILSTESDLFCSVKALHNLRSSISFYRVVILWLIILIIIKSLVRVGLLIIIEMLFKQQMKFYVKWETNFINYP